MPAPAYLLFKLILLLTLAFAACIGLIHAQPYDDSQLRAFLTSSRRCPMPCFLGIRPGVTTADEAVAILQGHDWVGEINLLYNRSREIYIAQWWWSGSQPDFLDGTKQAYLYVQGGTVETINAETRLSFGDLWLAMGKPDRGRMHSLSAESPIVFQYAAYTASSLGAQSMISCPIRLRDVFETRVTLSFIGHMDARYGDGAYDVADWAHNQPCA